MGTGTKSYRWLEQWDKTAPPPIKYREGINNFLLSLEGLTREDKDLIEQMYQEWWNSIAQGSSGKRLSPGSLMNLHSDLTKAIALHFEGRLTDVNSYRNPTGSHELRHIAQAYCKPPASISEAHNKRNQLRLIERVSNRGIIDKPFEIVARAERLLQKGMEANIYSDIAAALVVLTGRRVTEILVTACFYPATRYSVLFTGQLKTRGEEDTPTEIPTLIESHYIINALVRLRELFQVDDTNRNLLEDYKDNVRRKVIEVFCDLVPTIQMSVGEMRPTTHRMRAVYNCLATFFYAPPGLKDDLYTAAIMAHGSSNSTLNYTIYQIADHVIAAHGGKRQGILLDQPGVEVLLLCKSNSLESVARHTCADAAQGASVVSASTLETASSVAHPQIDPHSKQTASTGEGAFDQNSLHPQSDRSAIATPGNTLCQVAHRIRKCLNSALWGDLAVGLVAATGRSISELIKSGVFKATDDPNTISFSPQVATNQQIVPTPIPAAVVLKAIQRLRNHGWTKQERLRYCSPNQIEHSTSRIIAQFAAKEFTGIIPDATYQGLIAAYNALCPSIDPVWTSHSPVGESLSTPVQPPTGEQLTFTFEGELLAALRAIAIALNISDLEKNPQQCIGAILNFAKEKADTKENVCDAKESLLRAVDDKTRRSPTLEELAARITKLELQLANTCLQDNPSSPTPGATRTPNVCEQVGVAAKKTPQTTAQQRKNSAIEKIARAVTGVMAFNHQQRVRQRQWYLSASLIASLTGCNRPAINRYFQSQATLITSHNADNQLGSQHNNGRIHTPELNALKQFIMSQY